MGNISSSRWLDYAMNFLAVCMGIAITFGGESIVRSKAEKKEVGSSLSLVRDELLDNKSYIEQSDSVLAVFADAAGFLFLQVHWCCSFRHREYGNTSFKMPVQAIAHSFPRDPLFDCFDREVPTREG